MRKVNFVCAVLCAVCLSSFVSAQDLTVPATDQVYVSIDGNDVLQGAIVELSDLKVQTAFGEVSIPMTKVDGVKMHSDAKDNAVIAFKNGDLVTGKVVLKVIKLKTEWGTAHVNTEKVETVMNSKSARFYADNSTGRPVWRFTKAPVGRK